MADDWRVCIALDDLSSSPDSSRPELLLALRSRLGDQAGQVAVSSSATHILVYAPSIDVADEAARVAREVLHAPARTEGWDRRKQQWENADAMPADLASAGGHADRQEYERAIAAKFGLRRWQVRVELPSHLDVVKLAGHLAARGWRVRRRIRSLIIWADCEDDARALFLALSDGAGPDGDMAIRAGRVSIRCLEVWPGGTA